MRRQTMQAAGKAFLGDSTIMKQVEISDTGVKVSRLCLGTTTFGNPVPEPEAIRLVQW